MKEFSFLGELTLKFKMLTNLVNVDSNQYFYSNRMHLIALVTLQ